MNQVELPGNKRLFIALVIAAIIAAVFWSQSRIPALNEKAQMGLRTHFSSIAFDILLPVTAEQPAAERVAKTAVNWAYTNWKGMAFGLLFAAIALTILGLVAHRSFRRPWLNTLSGMFVGAPLGVCVNCATPIAQGMYAAGASLETALATLISSPTLNVIVLSMSFTLLPWEIALGNVVAVLLLLGLLPSLIRVSAAPVSGTRDIAATRLIQPPTAATPAVGDENILEALLAVSRQYTNNLIYIVKLAVPLMLLAGLLGALVIELAPFDLLATVDPTFIVIFVAAVLATFLPVPIAFNVIVVMALLAKGMHPGIGAVLLFALSVYSIYPATVIANYISVKLSVILAVAVILLGTGLGLLATSHFDNKLEANKLAIDDGFRAARDNVYKEIAAVCESLPDPLQRQCVANQIRSSKSTIPRADACLPVPDFLPLQECQAFVALITAEEQALELSSRAPCDDLSTLDLRGQCTRAFLTGMSLRHHDINYCDQLESEDRIQSCRVQYLNASLLFNPDDSVCKDLTGRDQSICEVNARIYRIADTLEMSGCDSVPTDAWEHCRWVTASNMVGRNNDASGCNELDSRTGRLRCQEQVIAWQATRDQSFASCEDLRSPGLKETCLLKVAERKTATILTNYSLNVAQASNVRVAAGSDSSPAVPVLDTHAPEFKWQTVSVDREISISSIDYLDRTVPSGKANVFSRRPANAFGITRSWDFSFTDFFEPFIIGKGIASGDMNNDLWPDLVLASERGALFYRNVGGKFQLIDVPQGELQDKNLFLVALVDADNDGNQDLFASTYGDGNYLLLNRKNGFEETELVRLDSLQRLTISAGFGDLDQDGDLDIVLGNWSSGVEKLFSPEESTNYLLERDGDTYTTTAIEDVRGETNSVLIADVNGDGSPDLLFGNDRIVPDVYYLGTSEQQLAPVTRDSDVVPATSMFTMSLESADFNNDLKPDLFSTDMTFARSASAEYCDAVEDTDDRARCEDIVAAYDEFSNGSARSCQELGFVGDIVDCYVAHSIRAAQTLKDASYCNKLPDASSPLHSLCMHISAPIPAEQAINQDDYLPQVQRNVLLTNNGGTFSDTTEAMGVDSSFWSWNAKAADLDNDGWQDIYVGNGFHFGDSFYEVQPNVLFRNLGGDGFEEIAADWGLDDTINTPSYTYIDFDLDGDIDIIATGVLAPPRIFVNEHANGNSVTFLLEDERSNAFAIGSTITISYGDNQQRKEIKMSGGFMSFDNPAAHFGIASFSEIDSFSITWPDGQVTEHDGALPANRFYRVRRNR